MAFYDTTWYCNSVGYAAITARPQNTAVAAGVVRRQFTTPAVNSERCFVCIVAGTTANVTDATWTLTRGAKSTDGTATWQECTGASAVNGDATNTVNWTAAKAAGTPTLGAIIKRNNGASYQICSTAGTMAASEPSFSDTAGVTTNDGTSVWTSLGVVGNFTGGQATHARLVNACASTWFAAGNTVYIADNHAETQATAITIVPAGSATTVGRILCHNHSGSYPPAAADLTTGATVSTSGNVTTSFTPSGSFYVYGVAFKAAVGVAGSTGSYLTLSPSAGVTGIQLYFDRCSLEIAATASGAWLQVGASTAGLACNIVFNNTTTKFGSTGQFINVTSIQFVWQNTGSVLVSGSSVPAVCLQPSGTAQGTSHNIVLEALDLDQLTGALCGSSNFETGAVLIKDCKLNASATITTPANTGITFQLVRSDSGATNYKAARYTYEGTQTVETSITRVGGATDGTTASSDKIVTTANSQWLRPFQMMPLAIWNDTTGADVTVAVYGTINSGTLPNNDEIWMEVEYIGSSSAPLGTIKTTTKASVLAASAAVSSDGSTWNGGGSGAGWSPFKLVATLTSPQPQMKGYVYINVKAAKASTTYYVDPLPVLS